jgi:hypothetical protein
MLEDLCPVGAIGEYPLAGHIITAITTVIMTTEAMREGLLQKQAIDFVYR